MGLQATSLLRTGGIVLGILAVVAAAVALVVSRDSPERPRARAERTPLPTPRSIVRHGVRYRVAPRPPSGVIAEPGSRTVTVYAMDVEKRSQPDCSSLDPRVRLVSETAGSVRIATFAYVVPARGEGKRLCLYNVGGSPSLYAARRVRLGQPLGHRRLVDDGSGKQLGVLDAGYVPTPAYVPNGYRQSWVMRYTPRDDFQALRQFRRGATLLSVRVSSEVTWSSSGRLRGHARVGGAVARVSDGADERCVSWSPRGGLVTEVCSLSDGRFLAVDELLRVARGVV